jgi:hypothetical protein
VGVQLDTGLGKRLTARCFAKKDPGPSGFCKFFNIGGVLISHAAADVAEIMDGAAHTRPPTICAVVVINLVACPVCLVQWSRGLLMLMGGHGAGCAVSCSRNCHGRPQIGWINSNLVKSLHAAEGCAAYYLAMQSSPLDLTTLLAGHPRQTYSVHMHVRVPVCWLAPWQQP